MILTGINIRSGLELDIPVSEIFNVNVAPDGNPLAKKCFNPDGEINIQMSKELKKALSKNDCIFYSDLKIPHKITDTLVCYVFDSYFVFEDDSAPGKIQAEKNVELLFVNKEILNLENFCKNIMEAQAFTGSFEKQQTHHQFMGVGSFSLDDYLPLGELISQSNLDLLNFYVFYKKILSSIGYFVFGLFENDVKNQKKYLTESEYKNLMSLAKRQKQNLLNNFKRSTDSDPLDFGFFSQD